jgi:hypothetical protein
MNPPIGTIVTHDSPSMDAITATWLLQRYGALPNEDVLFVPARAGAEDEVVAGARAVVDVGGVFDPSTLRFDHHQMGKSANNTCATMQVFEHLANKGVEVAHLRPLINLVFCADTGKKEYGASTTYVTGIHALLNGYKRRVELEVMPRHERDMAVLRYGYSLLDTMDDALAARWEAKDTMEAHTTWMSSDGVIRVLEDATPTMSHLAHESGTQIVLFSSEERKENKTSYAMGLMRSDDHRYLNMGDLLMATLRRFGDELPEEAEAELRTTWVAHPSGFMVGRGTRKNPNYTPSVVPPVILAQLIHRTHVLREEERFPRKAGL